MGLSRLMTMTATVLLQRVTVLTRLIYTNKYGINIGALNLCIHCPNSKSVNRVKPTSNACKRKLSIVTTA